MANKSLKILELSVIIIQFVSSIITAVYCSYCLSDINQVFMNSNYKYYLSDFKKKFQIHVNITSSNNSSYSFQETDLSEILNGTCTRTACTSTSLTSNKWKGMYININDMQGLDESNWGFTITDLTESCGVGKKECMRNSYYKTCVNDGCICPITGIISRNTEMSDKLQNYFQIANENYSSYNLTSISTIEEFKFVNNFSYVGPYLNNLLMITRLADGVPIIYTQIVVDNPCHLDYIIKSNFYLEFINQIDYKATVFNCSNFEDPSITLDSSGDIDMDKFYYEYINGNIYNPSTSTSDEYIDNRYFQVDSTDLLSLITNQTGLNKAIVSIHGVQGNNASLFTRKMLYAKKECMVTMFKISSLIDVYNIAPIRILLLRYLNWNFIDIIFIIMLNILLRGYYIVKRLQRSSTNRIDEDEKKFQKETNLVVKLLHYFVIVIKLISILVSKYSQDSSVIPTDLNFYNNCLTDSLSIQTYRNINNIFLDLFENISIISNINIWTLVYDFIITLYIIINSYSYSRALKKKIKYKFR